MTPDIRTVHAYTNEGSQIVRYDRAGKWYLENERTRTRLSIAEAVRFALNGTAFLGRYGGSRFDALVKKAREVSS